MEATATTPGMEVTSSGGLVEWLRSAGLALALALLPFLVFGAETLGQRVYYHHDLQYYFYPYHKLVADMIAQGQAPLWNPYAFSGLPLLGDGQAAPFYPPHWLFLAFPAAHALALCVLLHFSIAGVGMFLYCRGLGSSRLAATLAGLAFMFNGFLVSRVVHLSIMAGAALVPLIFWAVDRMLRRGSAGSFVLAALTILLQALAGHPQIPIYTMLALGAYVLVLSLRRWWRRGRPGWGLVQLAGIYLLGYALAAIQLAPWVELASFSPRAAGADYQFVTTHSIKGFDWLLLLFPYGYGGMVSNWLQSTPAWDLPAYLWERLGYVGVLPLALAFVGLAELLLPRRQAPRQAPKPVEEPAPALPEPDVPRAPVSSLDALRDALFMAIPEEREPTAEELEAAAFRRDRLWALALVLVLSLLIAAGDSTYFGQLIYAIPVVGRLRGYARAVGVADVALVALAAYGVDRLARYGEAPAAAGARRRLDWAPLLAALLPILGAGAGLAAANMIGSQHKDPMARGLFERLNQPELGNTAVPLGLVLGSAVLLLWASRGLTRVKALAMLALVAFDLLAFATSFNPTTDPQVFERTPPSVEFLRGDPALFRVAAFTGNDRVPPEVAQSQLAISWALPYHVEEINGFNSLQPRRYTDFLFGRDVQDVSYGFLHNGALLSANPTMLDMLGVKYALLQQGSPLTPAPEWRQVYADQNVSIYQSPHSPERAYFVQEVSAEPAPDAVLDQVTRPGFSPTRTAYVEDIDADAARVLSQTGVATATVQRVAPNELRITTSTSVERFLVLSEMWFPGWRAELLRPEGGVEPLPIYRANYLFRGLRVPAGEQTIRMVYMPDSLLVGAAISGGAALIALIALIVGAWRGRRRESLF